MLLPRQDTKQEPALNFENTLQSKLTMLSNKYSTSFTIEKISNLFYSILIHNSGSSLHLTAKDDNAYSVEDTNGIDAIIVSKAQEAAKNGAPIESLVSLVFKGKR